MRKLSPLLAVTAICGMAALPQTGSADAIRPDTRAEDFSYYGGGYYAYDDYYAGPYHPAAPYYDDGYYYPPPIMPVPTRSRSRCRSALVSVSGSAMGTGWATTRIRPSSG